MPPVWFQQKKEKSGFIGFVKPVAWQGWVVHLLMVFVVAMLAQMLGRWALILGFKPLGQGIWLLTILFLVLGLYFRAVSYFSGPKDPPA